MQIDLRNVSKSYRGGRNHAGVKALQDVNLSIRAGEIVGLLGPSGCGKSTILNIVGGLDQEFNGAVSIQGRSIEEQVSAGFRISYVFQDSRLLPWKSVRKNIEFALEAAQFPRMQWASRIEKILELVELTKFAEFYPSQLSGGMQQRASIARAFAIEPDILLMDEPFSALDELTARRLRQSLLKIWDSFRSTILFVSHNAYESSFLGDRVLILSKSPGRIREEINLSYLGRPRSYDDAALFEQSKKIIRSLESYSQDDERF